MDNFILLLVSFWTNIINMFDRYKFSIFGIEVSYFSLLFGFIIITFVLSFIWKGAKA